MSSREDVTRYEKKMMTKRVKGGIPPRDAMMEEFGVDIKNSPFYRVEYHDGNYIVYKVFDIEAELFEKYEYMTEDGGYWIPTAAEYHMTQEAYDDYISEGFLPGTEHFHGAVILDGTGVVPDEFYVEIPKPRGGGKPKKRKPVGGGDLELDDPDLDDPELDDPEIDPNGPKKKKPSGEDDPEIDPNDPKKKKPSGEDDPEIDPNDPKKKKPSGEDDPEIDPNGPKKKKSSGEDDPEIDPNDPKKKKPSGEDDPEIDPNGPKKKKPSGEDNPEIDPNDPKKKKPSGEDDPEIDPNDPKKRKKRPPRDPKDIYGDDDIDPEVEFESLKNEKIQDMLDKYYGNRRKEAEYKRRMKRFKSHLVDREYEHGTYKTIEAYEGYEEDVKFLQLDEFAYRLERLSKAELGDMTAYEEEADKLVAAFGGDDKDRTYFINLLRQQDARYIATNNFAYNQHRATQENLRTLGKYGEKVPFLKMSKIKGESQKFRKVVGNVGVVVFNTFLLGRNYVLAPIDRFIGTFMVAPVHRLLIDSDKTTAGLYKNHATHRYSARKKFFEEQYLEQVKKENERLEAEGKKPKKPSVFKLVFQPRIYAITRYKEGNISVLAPKGNEIVASVRTHVAARVDRRNKLETLEGKRDALLVQMSGIEEEIRTTTDLDEKQKLEVLLQNGAKKLVSLEEEISTTRSRFIPGVIQTDAVSLETHDLTNKSNVTKVVTGVKTVVRSAAMHFVGKNLSKLISEQITEEKHIPEHYIDQEVFHPEQVVQEEVMVEIKKQLETMGFDREALEKLTVGDLLELTKNGKITYFGNSTGREIDKGADLFIRGIYDHDDFMGLSVSGSDGVGFDVAGRTESMIGKISHDDNLFEVLAETMTSNGSPITASELIERMLESKDALGVFEDMKNIQLWVSTSSKGMPQGWLNVADSFDALKDEMLIKGTETVTEVEKQIVDKVIPAYTEVVQTLVPGHTETVVSEVTRRVIDGRAAAVESLLALGGARDLYELLRRTKGSEEMVQEGTKTQVLPHQVRNLPKLGERDYTNNFGFDGTRRGDYASIYTESEPVVVEESTGRKR